MNTKIILDSTNPWGGRLTTWVLTYPRFIHAEFMTHRCFSRNASSSRAIPIEKMIDAVKSRTAMPKYWGSNKPGMQAGSQLDGNDLEYAIHYWESAMQNAALSARSLSSCHVHKQIANRVLEPFSHITVIATASTRGLVNFFALRAHEEAQPEFQVLAYRMLRDYLESVPKQLDGGDWHTPFCPDDDEVRSYLGEGNDDFHSFMRIKRAIATGRIARVSYLTHEGIRDPRKDMELHDSLKKNGHMSPFEHIAQAVVPPKSKAGMFSSNFDPGWIQYRKFISNELRELTTLELKEVLAKRPDWVNLD